MGHTTSQRLQQFQKRKFIRDFFNLKRRKDSLQRSTYWNKSHLKVQTGNCSMSKSTFEWNQRFGRSSTWWRQLRSRPGSSETGPSGPCWWRPSGRSCWWPSSSWGGSCEGNAASDSEPGFEAEPLTAASSGRSLQIKIGVERSESFGRRNVANTASLRFSTKMLKISFSKSRCEAKCL